MFDFLYRSFSKGSKIIIYGDGFRGGIIYSHMVKTGYCDLVCILDPKYASTEIVENVNKEILRLNPEAIKNIPVTDYDFVVISTDSEQGSKVMYSTLLKFGVPKDKILSWNMLVAKEQGFTQIPQAKISAGFYWDKKTGEHLNNPLFLESYGYKVYSQNDEDGIIAEIFRRIGVTNKVFVEFGVENGLECNSHCLLLKGWFGLWIEGDSSKFMQIHNRFSGVIAGNQLQVHNEFITIDNVNSIFEAYRFNGEIDMLSIDIDGNDYHIFKQISVISPRCLVIEYNGKLPPDCEWVMNYDTSYEWDGSDRHGASLKSLEILADYKGYQLVGTNYAGVNAFFVRKDLAKDLFPQPATAENLYNPARFQDSICYCNGHRSNECLLNFGKSEMMPVRVSS